MLKSFAAAALAAICFGAAENPATPNDRVHGVFQAFILSERSVKLIPGQMDLAWSDIPALLELGSSTRVIDAKTHIFGRMYMTEVPTAPPPAEGQAHAIEGMIALWMVEGIRCGQGASFRPPLYAFCFRANLSQNECETSDAIHRDALAAYQRWWKKVKDLPMNEAATVDPLAAVGLRWCGPQAVCEAQPEPSAAQEPHAKAATLPKGLPDPPFTVDEVAAYHRKQTGSTLSPEMLKRFYLSATNDFARETDRSGLLDTARRALAFDQDEPTRLLLYSRLTDGYFYQKGRPLAQQRKNAAQVLLVGLREVLAHDLPDARPALPGVRVYNVNGPKEVIEEAKKKHRAEMDAREKAQAIETLVDFRTQFTERLVSEYGYRERTPQALDELHDLALRYLGDETAAQQLRAAAEAYTGSNHVPPVLRLAKPQSK